MAILFDKSLILLHFMLAITLLIKYNRITKSDDAFLKMKGGERIKETIFIKIKVLGFYFEIKIIRERK